MSPKGQDNEKSLYCVFYLGNELLFLYMEKTSKKRDSEIVD